MNTSEKLYAAMRRNANDWSLQDLQTVARRRLITWHHHGSHCIFTRSDGEALSVPAHRTVKPVYVKQFVLFVEGK
jgi:hypothetical protein